MPFRFGSRPQRGEATALISAGKTMSFEALDRAADRAARRIVGHGVAPGEVVALKGRPDVQLLVALHAIWKAGAVPFPMNPRWAHAEERRAMHLLSPSFVLLGEGMAPVPGDLEQRVLGGQGKATAAGLGRLPPDPGPLPISHFPEGVPDGMPAAHLLTSGTSGEPETVTLTFGNLRASARGSRERLSLGPSDRWLASLSLAHVGGMALVSRAAFLGSSLLFCGGFRAATVKDLLLEGSFTHASLVPTMLRQLLDLWGDRQAPPSLRCLLIGGAQADEALVERALALGFPLALTYGLTEASSQVATAPPELVKAKPGAVGPPLPGVQLRISREGEILVKGPTVAPARVSADGWLRTGDLGRMDADGHLWVTGRISHRIISGGVNVDPTEVETVLRSHPGVRDAVVVGVPDPAWGERVVAALVPEHPLGVRTEEIHQLARNTLSPAKRPKELRVVDALPRNANGKVARSRVRELFDRRMPGGPGAGSRPKPDGRSVEGR
ncbi:MAG: class I adenylate-forming enzyme family protein [Longimicrobiales bacterium]